MANEEHLNLIKDRLHECESMIDRIESADGPDAMIRWNGHQHPQAMAYAYLRLLLDEAEVAAERARLSCFGVAR